MRQRLLLLASLAFVGAGGLVAYSYSVPAGAGVEEIQLAAGQQTATFKIEDMTCASCPITVRIAMQRVAGVASVKIDFEAKTEI